jgi:snoRNA binding domain, fibrillarin
VPATVVVRRGPRYFVVPSGEAPPLPFPSRVDPESAARAEAAHGSLPLSEALLQHLRSLPATTEISTDDPERATYLAQNIGRPVAFAGLRDIRAARGRLPLEARDEERLFLLGLAQGRLERALRSPEEVLITLAREEERLERVLGRESRAAAALLPVPVGPITDYHRSWESMRARLADHHGALARSVEQAARQVVPNLSAVVGERAAARLVAAAGGVNALARMRAPRLQLLGSRRRPSAEHGPRFGVLYRGARMGDVPVDRRAAYARSLAALGAIAIRADATTHRDLTALLTARRDRRIEQLRRRRG